MTDHKIVRPTLLRHEQRVPTDRVNGDILDRAVLDAGERLQRQALQQGMTLPGGEVTVEIVVVATGYGYPRPEVPGYAGLSAQRWQAIVDCVEPGQPAAFAWEGAEVAG